MRRGRREGCDERLKESEGSDVGFYKMRGWWG